MPNDERILETTPVGSLGLIPTDSCKELGDKVDFYLKQWREHREHEHHNEAAFKDYFTGAIDLDSAKANFETSVMEKYPELTEVVWPE